MVDLIKRARLLSSALAFCSLLSAGCSSSPTATVADSGPDAAVTVPDARVRDMGHGAETRLTDLAAADGPAADVRRRPGGFIEARTILHLHSIYSHDACDGVGFIEGAPNLECLQQLREGICAGGFDYVGLTDHPSNMQDFTLTEDLLYDSTAGDQLILEGGAPIANRMACPGGGRPLLTVGFEAGHMMPLGFHEMPTAEPLFENASDNTDMTLLTAQIQGLKDLGAVVSLVHSEDPDISPPTIVTAGYDAMEWYNIHGNMTKLFNADMLSFDLANLPNLTMLLGKLIDLSDFISAPAGGPHPDLIYLQFMEAWPEEGFQKWREVQNSRLVTGILGSDIHQNLSVDASVCAGAMQPLCASAFALIEGMLGSPIPPSIQSLLLSGGKILLSDGDRVDSYTRLLRWLENRVLVTQIDPLQIQDALRRGRVYGVFTVFGDPGDFSFTATQGDRLLQMGESAQGALTFEVSVPTRPVFQRGAPFTEAEALSAAVRARLIRIDGSGKSVIHEGTFLGEQISLEQSAPGAYYVELLIKPNHLVTALGTAAALAEKEYLWVITNPIFIAP